MLSFALITQLVLIKKHLQYTVRTTFLSSEVLFRHNNHPLAKFAYAAYNLNNYLAFVVHY